MRHDFVVAMHCVKRVYSGIKGPTCIDTNLGVKYIVLKLNRARDKRCTCMSLFQGVHPLYNTFIQADRGNRFRPVWHRQQGTVAEQPQQGVGVCCEDTPRWCKWRRQGEVPTGGSRQRAVSQPQRGTAFGGCDFGWTRKCCSSNSSITSRPSIRPRPQINHALSPALIEIANTLK